MTHEKYKIAKLRFGLDGNWEPWEYEAKSLTANYQLLGNAERGVTGRHKSIDALAKELATFPEITSAFFVPEDEGVPRLSIGRGSFTQEAITSDEELGELAVLIFRYTRK
jgi:hypothetical protein